MAIDLLSEGGDLSAGNVGDLLQAMAAVSNYMFHKVFGDNQKGKKAVRWELSRMVGQEKSRDRFGSCQGERSKVLSRTALLGSSRGDLLALGRFNHSWRGDAVLD